MPHLVFCNRLFKLSSDELFIPATFAMVTRAIWIGILCFIFAYVFASLEECSNGSYIISYFSITIGITVLTFMSEMKIHNISTKGTVIDSKERGNMKLFLKLHVVLGVLQFLCGVFGICLLLKKKLPCHNHMNGIVVEVLLAFVALAQILDLASLGCCCVLFSSPTKEKDESSYEDLQNSFHTVGDKRHAKIPTVPTRMEETKKEHMKEDMKEDTETKTEEELHEAAKTKYESCCKALCRTVQLSTCNLFGGVETYENKFEEVADIFVRFLHYDGFVDLVPSDIVVGLLILRLQHRVKKRQLQEQGRLSCLSNQTQKDDEITETTGNSIDDVEMKCYHFTDQSDEVIEVPNALVGVTGRVSAYLLEQPVVNKGGKIAVPADMGIIKEAAHYVHYVLAIYSSYMFMYMNPCTAICKLACFGICSRRCCTDVNSGDNARVQGETKCGMDTSSLLKMARWGKSQLIYVNYQNTHLCRPYAVFRDLEKNAIVVTIRGTLSLEDCMIDVMATPIHMSLAGEEFADKNFYAHKGMLQSAMQIRTELVNVVNLDELMKSTSKPATKLIILGHSLGAGTAAVLAMLLKPRYPSLKCFGFGMPGSVICLNAIAASRDYITSVVLGNDLVTRLSVSAMENLRSEILSNISRCKVSKMTLIQKVFSHSDIVLDEILYSEENIPKTKLRNTIEDYKLTMRLKTSLLLKNATLAHPGHIIHIRKIGKAPVGCSQKMKPVFHPFESNNTCFEELVISPTMASHHLPDNYTEVLERMVAEHEFSDN